MGKTAMDKKSYLRQVPRIDLDETLFPPEKAVTGINKYSEIGNESAVKMESVIQ